MVFIWFFPKTGCYTLGVGAMIRGTEVTRLGAELRAPNRRGINVETT